MPRKLPSSGDGASGTGAGFGGFFITAFFFAGVAFFILFFLRVGALRFAFLDFFATANLLIGSAKIYEHEVYFVYCENVFDANQSYVLKTNFLLCEEISLPIQEVKMGELNKSHPTYLCPMHTDLIATHNQ